jgi:hypothetical protein
VHSQLEELRRVGLEPGAYIDHANGARDAAGGTPSDDAIRTTGRAQLLPPDYLTEAVIGFAPLAE